MEKTTEDAMTKLGRVSQERGGIRKEGFPDYLLMIPTLGVLHHIQERSPAFPIVRSIIVIGH
jgi:hypothetical protein